MLRPHAGDVLRHARWAKGWTIQKLSEEASVSLNLIVKIENGGQPSQGQKVYALARCLEIDPADLFEEVVYCLEIDPADLFEEVVSA